MFPSEANCCEMANRRGLRVTWLQDLQEKLREMRKPSGR